MREGSVIGSYRIVRRIGEGGMGAVYLGEHTLLRRHAAIKVLLPELSSKRESVDRFFNEARATTVIPDPGIVQVFDFGFTAQKAAYIVMELLEGESLGQRLRRLGTLAPADALRITRQIAGSLGAAHAAGVVHRDLKPDNLFMIRDPEAPSGERPKILDFGIAKLGDDISDRLRTQTGAVLGTPVYMSPEQCSGEGRVDHRADIYSLGCVLFHLVTGRPPFDLPGIGALISAHLREPPPRASRWAHLPPGVDELVLRCLDKSPDERFATMAELQHACDTILARLQAGGAATVPLHATPGTPMRPPAPMTVPLYAAGRGPATPEPSGDPAAAPPAGYPPASYPPPGFASTGAPPASYANGHVPTTLGHSVGQSLAVGRRRVGLWVAALAGLGVATGIAVAFLTAGPPGHQAAQPSSATSPAPPPAKSVEPPAAGASSAVVPMVVVPPPVAVPADAARSEQPGAGSSEPAQGQAGQPATPVGQSAGEPADKSSTSTTHKPPAKPTARSKSKPSPTEDDVYEDRN